MGVNPIKKAALLEQSQFKIKSFCVGWVRERSELSHHSGPPDGGIFCFAKEATLLEQPQFKIKPFCVGWVREQSELSHHR